MCRHITLRRRRRRHRRRLIQVRAQKPPPLSPKSPPESPEKQVLKSSDFARTTQLPVGRKRSIGYGRTAELVEYMHRDLRRRTLEEY
ncbi:hypothetical protein TcasGA2_TC003625 [Tribolium castaneum]|uniref:Uncharacterized protein n=1 Tax=Tribolium castaneum TaxID=7070 RepID=D6WIC9_TRICA|nr:hypothetical protein TcasGA2_TC003625 [Tribolium castaneum]